MRTIPAKTGTETPCILFVIPFKMNHNLKRTCCSTLRITYSKKQEGNDVVHGTEEEPEPGTKTVGDQNGQTY